MRRTIGRFFEDHDRGYVRTIERHIETMIGGCVQIIGDFLESSIEDECGSLEDFFGTIDRG
jgi:hypothetical protein